LTFLTAYKVRTEKRSCTLKTEYQIIRYYPAAGKSMPATSAVRHNPLMRGAINTCREYWAAPNMAMKRSSPTILPPSHSCTRWGRLGAILGGE
jgi:hypothetical protein